MAPATNTDYALDASTELEVIVEPVPDDRYEGDYSSAVEEYLDEELMHDLEHEEAVFAAQALDKTIESMLYLFMSIDPVLTQVANISKATNEDVTKAFALLGQAAQIRNIRMKGEGEDGGS